MLLDNEVKITPSGKGILYYKEKGYLVNGRNPIIVKIEHLQNQSSVEVNVKCDVCELEKKTEFYLYIKNTKNKSEPYCCSRKCANQKIKNTCLIKYGVENPLKNKHIKEKIKLTNIEKYGFEFPMQNKQIQEKTKKTNLERHGSKYTFQIDYVKDKIKKSNLEMFGFENVSKNEQIKLKKIETCKKNNGTEHPSQNIEIKNRQIKIFNDKYGGNSPTCSKEVIKKIQETNLKKYGGVSSMCSEDVKNKAKKTWLKKTKNEKHLINKKREDTFLTRYGVKNPLQDFNIFEKQQKNAKRLKIHEQTGLKYQGKYEAHFLDYCFENKIKVEKAKSIKYNFENKQKVYHPDFFLREKNLIIEIKSSYTYNKDLKKNIAKQNACIKKGFNFIFIIDKDYKKFKIKSATE